GAADLGAGAGCGWHGDDRRDAGRVGARPPIADVFEVPYRPRLRLHEGDAFADVERRAAADGDDAVMAAGLVGGDPGGEIGLRRVRLDVAEHRRLEARRSQPFDDA